MRLDTLALAAVTGGTALGPVVAFSGISIDSRAAEEGDLFVAVRGERLDGNDFVAEALGKAAGALVSRPFDLSTLPAGRAVVRVADTLAGLRALARHALDTIRPRVVAVTGSVGKTTTKELLSGILSRRLRTVRSRGNLNNQYGLPLEVARMPEGTEAAVLEMGMSTPGEIRSLSELVLPDVAIVTAVAPVHLQSFSSIDGIRDAKGEVLAGMGPSSTFVANADDPRVLQIAARHGGPVLRYGLADELSGPRPGAPPLDAWASSLVPEAAGSRFLLHLRGETAEVTLSLPGRHNVLNFLGAAAAASVLGASASDAASAAAHLSPARHRGEVRGIAGDVLLYDDCYNSSPVALRAAYAAFEAAAAGRRKVAVLGEMRELGPGSREFHAAAGREIGRRADLLVAVQGDAEAIAEGARDAGARDVHLVRGAAEALALVRESLRPGDALFVKGSRGVGLDRLVDALAGEEAKWA